MTPEQEAEVAKQTEGDAEEESSEAAE